MSVKTMLTEERNPNSSRLDEKPIEEILEIINSEDRRVAEAVGRAIPQLVEGVKAFIRCYKRGGRIFYVGGGTSGYLGTLDALECPTTFGVSPHRIQGILVEDEREDDRLSGRKLVRERGMDDKDLVIAISASGETPFVISCVEAARIREVETIGITNNPGSTLESICAIPITAVVGPEVIGGSTRMKAGTAQKMILNMLSTTAMAKLGKVYDNLMVDLEATNSKLKRRAEMILQYLLDEEEAAIKELLARANYEVKAALVMFKRGYSYKEAKEILEKHNGFLRRALREIDESFT